VVKNLIFILALFTFTAKAQFLDYQLLKEYQDLCYADSTLECFNVFVYGTDTLYSFCNNLDMDLGMDPGYKGTIHKWVHRTPTFEGVLKFLENKYKQFLEMDIGIRIE